MFPTWLNLLSKLSLTLGLASAAWLALDVRRRPPKMKIMAFVWPLTGLFGGPALLAFYRRYGRASTPQGQRAHAQKTTTETPFGVAVAKGALHCGAGCALGDIVAESTAFVAPALLLPFGYPWATSERIFAVWGYDFVLAFALGIVFQYHAIVPMRKLGFWPGLWAALKADTLSLTAWQVGMYGFMGWAHFWLFKSVLGVTLTADRPEFWFMMQLAMGAGFATAYPMNWWLIRRGIKERM